MTPRAAGFLSAASVALAALLAASLAKTAPDEGDCSWRVVAFEGRAPRVTLSAVDVASNGNVWAAGGAHVFRLVSGRWRREQLPSLKGTSELVALTTRGSEAWAVGETENEGLALHWNGWRWRRAATPAIYGLAAVEATSQGVFAVGGGPRVLRWTGLRWRYASSSLHPQTNRLSGIAEVGSRVLVVGHVLDNNESSSMLAAVKQRGRPWTRVPAPPRLSPVGGRGSGDELTHASAAGGRAWVTGWAARGGGFVVRWDGRRWTFDRRPTLDRRPGGWLDLFDVAAVSDADAWIVALQGVFKVNARKWTRQVLPADEGEMQSIDTADRTVWVVGNDGTWPNPRARSLRGDCRTRD